MTLTDEKSETICLLLLSERGKKNHLYVIPQLSDGKNGNKKSKPNWNASKLDSRRESEPEALTSHHSGPNWKSHEEGNFSDYYYDFKLHLLEEEESYGFIDKGFGYFKQWCFEIGLIISSQSHFL